MINHDEQQQFVNGFKFTDRFCNFTAFPKNGCEEPKSTTCIDNKCACREESNYIIMGRFCTKKLCSNGEYYNDDYGKCIPQSVASVDVSENHCRYDYHCFGQNVKCRVFGWNYICFCDPGFRYDSLTKTCLPKHGIGGHCINDNDCDDTTLRKMYCDFKNELNSDLPADNKNNDGKQSSGTCQCQDNHRFNYNIDGCEPMADIIEREHNMRTLVLLFVAAGLLFGLAMTCNFSFFGLSGSKQQELFLQQLKAEDRIRQRKRNQESVFSKVENGQTSTLPEMNGKNKTEINQQQSSTMAVTSNNNDDNSIITINDDDNVGKKIEPKSSLIVFG
ncbi:hypothetical protein BLA29_005455 [Euroglyphus maynei]|uniref:Uncharacterized protein n=1 Tax=Euroglyphus maynei TaxID=6958 RepID=A0A1Y3B6I5_EURMA|nr:hypothetical protein BLA29_005455 [Euroglyphus maynei]